MVKLTWTREAELWLREIHSYVERENPVAAQSVTLGIQNRARQLRSYPHLGHRFEKFIDREVRILLYGHYRIVYLIRHSGDIEILGVFHGALDIDRYVF